MAKRLRRESSGSPPTSPLQTAPDPDPEEAPKMDISGHTPKYIELDHDAPLLSPSSMQCSLPPHRVLTFATYDDYEAHYNSSHTNRCRECQKNFPSSHFLHLHQAENHDPIVAAKRDRGDKTFACFLQDCDRVCLDWKKRRSHLVDKHGFPRNYDFFVVNSGIDGRRSMLRPGIDNQGHRKSSRERRGSSATEITQTTEATSISQRTSATDSSILSSGSELNPAVRPFRPSTYMDQTTMDEMTKSMSSLQFVPRSITFGRRKGKTGFSKS